MELKGDEEMRGLLARRRQQGQHLTMTDSKKFKDQISVHTVEELAGRFAGQLPAFDVIGFQTHAMEGLEDLELKARLKQVARAARGAWAGPLDELIAALPRVAIEPTELHGFAIWPLLQVIEDHGLPARQASLDAMLVLTERWSAEFAIRPFLRADPARTLALLKSWTAHPNEHVRRLVSEGTRPRLPWGGKLRKFDDDPKHTLPLLELLRTDSSAYVRRSVANHLNDLTKRHPDRVVEILKRWRGDDSSQETAWIVRHASRSLIKAGHRGALALRGFAPPSVVLESFSVGPNPLIFGDTLTLQTTLRATAAESQLWAVDFVIHHVKASGGRTPKVFKWREVRAAPGAVIRLDKRHPIRPITTRRYYPGAHRVEVLVNGLVLGGGNFVLAMPGDAG